ncbi:MAG: BamA/TamA family outer membrane protein [Armatimonadota bacterium]
MGTDTIRKLGIAVALALFAGFAVAQERPVGEILVRGNQHVARETILATMQTKVGQPYREELIQRDRRTLTDLNLFQDVKIFASLMDDDRWRVTVEVLEWPMVTRITIQGTTVVSEEEIRAVIQTKEGALFNPAHLVPDANAISDLYRSKGYFAQVVRYEPSASDPGTIEVQIVETKVNRILFTGLTKTRTGVLKKLMDQEEGQLLHSPTLTSDYRRLVDTQWFEGFDPSVREAGEIGSVDLILNFTETRTGLFNVGVQLDPRNRLAGILNVTETNFRGTGQSIGINLLQSTQGLGTSISLNYANPILDSKRTALAASVFSQETLVFGRTFFGGGEGLGTDNRFTQRRSGATVSVSRELNRNNRVAIGLRSELVDTNNFLPNPGEEFVLQDGIVTSVSLSFVSNRRDISIEPSHGDWLRVSAEPSFIDIRSVGGEREGHAILGTGFFTRLTFDYRRYFSEGGPRSPETFDTETRTVLATRLYAGTIFGQVPFFEQFFIGGVNGVRGYSEDRFWGRSALLAQVELRYPIQKAFNLVGFIDYGGAWDGYGGIRTFGQSRDFDLHLGYGVGISFRTALGPIRLDLGFDDQGNSRTHFTIGSSF